MRYYRSSCIQLKFEALSVNSGKSKTLDHYRACFAEKNPERSIGSICLYIISKSSNWKFQIKLYGCIKRCISSLVKKIRRIIIKNLNKKFWSAIQKFGILNMAFFLRILRILSFQWSRLWRYRRMQNWRSWLPRRSNLFQPRWILLMHLPWRIPKI